MEWAVVFDEARGAAIVTTRGAFDVADHARMVEDILASPRWRPGHPILFDHRALDFAGAGYEEMTAARDTHRSHDARIGAARTAILVRTGADFGRGRQFELVAEASVSAELAVFVDEEAAWRWLAAESAAE